MPRVTLICKSLYYKEAEKGNDLAMNTQQVASRDIKGTWCMERLVQLCRLGPPGSRNLTELRVKEKRSRNEQGKTSDRNTSLNL